MKLLGTFFPQTEDFYFIFSNLRIKESKFKIEVQIMQ